MIGQKYKVAEFSPELAPTAAHAGKLGETIARIQWCIASWEKDGKGMPYLEAITTALEYNLGPDWFVYQGGHHVAVHASKASSSPRLAMIVEA